MQWEQNKYMRYFNSESKNILKIAKDTAKHEKRKVLTIQQFYLSSLRNPKIESLLNKMDVDIRKLKMLLKEEIANSNNKATQEEIDSKDIDFSSILLKFLKEITEYHQKKLDLMKNNNLNESHALIEPYDLILCLFTLSRNDQQELQPVISIQNLIFECSMKSEDDKYEYQEFVVEINNICSKQMKDKLNLKEEYSIREVKKDTNEDSTTTTNEEIEQKGDVKLTNFADNMNLQCKQGKYETNVIGRESEIANLEKILLRKNKNNPVLVGEHGVGKSVVIEKLVSNIVNNNVPDILKGAQVWSLNVSKLISGTKYRGDFEKRMNALIDELKTNKNNILYIDNIQQILNAGSGGTQGLDVAGLLQPALEEGHFKCVGSIGFDEYNKIFSSDKGLARRFQKIIVSEPSAETTLEILKNTSINYEKHHHVEYPEDVLESIVKLSDRYLHHRSFPDKAIDLLDETGALYSSKQKKGKKVKVSDVYEVVSQQANLKLVNEKEQIKKLKTLKESLNKSVHGQPEAINTLTKAVLTAKAGLNNPKKPYGSFLFLGPTGVGKTEITLKLGEELGMKVHRFDMSEYMEEHSASKLIGTPPGYVGHEEGGQLTDAVDKEPYSIILFDEIEKANKKIYNTLLQVLDNGFLTDSKGKHVSFRNTIIILTSNAGAANLEKKEIGFGSYTDKGTKASIDLSILTKLFSPEFRNRLSSIVTFDFLSEEVVLKIVDKFVLELEEQIKEKNVKLTLTSSAKKWLMTKGYNKNMGARPMERAIDEHIKQVLSYELLFGELSDGGEVKIGKKNDQLVFTYK
jgi:ATP-dependent Clp protease ATP-binding subunit ClpA